MKNKLILSTLPKTWIFDLDGTIVKHNGYKIDGKDTLLKGCKEFFEKISKDDMVLIVTAREAKYKEETEEFLRENNIRYNFIIYDAPKGERIIINDQKPNGLNCSVAINTKRDCFCDTEIIFDEKI